MNYLSVCSGIEAATQAWHPLGWTPVAFSEIEPFPSAVLQHHYPDVPNLGDMNDFKSWPKLDLDLLVGGTPCQSFSVAGLRKGLDDPRGNLALTFCAIADQYKPRWVCWENVPGVLSADGGRAFGSILGALAELGYGLAYRVLDTQYIRTQRFPRAIPQRRRRVFIVGYLGDATNASKVLSIPQGVCGYPAPRREKREDTTGSTTSRLVAFGEYADDGTGSALKARDYKDATDLITQPVAFSSNMSVPDCVTDGSTPTLKLGGHGGGNPPAISLATQVRRLTPVECERLQGFPDNYTRIPWLNKSAEDCPDGPRYKALGNSMSVNVMEFIGEQINAVEKEN